MTPRRALAALLVAGTVLVATAAAGPWTSAAHAAPRDLPPAELSRLKKIFNPELKPFGLHLTRGLLQNLETYEPDPRGTHLALYVEPKNPGYTDAQYVANFTKLTRKFVPSVFKRWKGLESFDICQEPVDDPREVPPPNTQIFVSRTALDRVGNWKKATLAELLAASPRARSVKAGYYVYFAPALRSEPAFATAATEAGWTTTSTAFRH